MNTSVRVNTFAYTVTFLSDKLLTSLQLIIRESGLSPAKLSRDWTALDRGIRRWLSDNDLEEVTLEVIDPSDGGLLVRWDFPIEYSDHQNSDGGMWADTDALKFAIRKTGRWPAECDYRVLVRTKEGAAAVDGWTTTAFQSTAGLYRHHIGTTIGAPGAGAGAAYWAKG